MGASTVVRPILQRRCSCGQHTSGGECEECRKKDGPAAGYGSLQRKAVNATTASQVPPIVHERPHEVPTIGFDFSRVRVHTDARAAESALAADSARTSPGQRDAAPPRFYSGASDCSPTWYGDTSPEMDAKGESFTGKLIVKFNDAELKDPCVRECIELHESVHVKDLTPIVKEIHDCDAAAGSDWNKKGKCNQLATKGLEEAREKSECAAYQKSFTCLTLKILDPKDPCSKSPHRDEIQRHRQSEGCELKKHCAAAGTPEAGIPNT